jgi:hypothetical protein
MVANEGSIIYIPRGSRRFNVGTYQTKKLTELGDTADFAKRIPEELPDFASYLATRNADRQVARTALNNSAREVLIAEGETGLEQAAQAILEGDFQYYWDARPNTNGPSGSIGYQSVTQDMQNNAYMTLLRNIAEGKRSSLIREELYLLLNYVIGNIPSAPNKFSSLIKHHKLIITMISRGGKAMRGIKVNWNISASLKKEVLTAISKQGD